MLDHVFFVRHEHFQNWGSAGKKYSLSSTSKLQLHKGFKVSRNPCLILCSFKRLKHRRNLARYLASSGSLTLNIDFLLGLIKEGILFLKTAIDSEFCISGACCDHSDRKFGKKIWNNQFCNWKKAPLSLAYVIKAFTRWYNIKKVLTALSWR